MKDTFEHFDFVQLDFEDKVTSLNVTTPHIMIVYSKDKGFIAKAAKDVKVGDQMLCSKTGTVIRVSKISSFYKTRKINVETESGTLVANGLYVSGVCEYNPRIQNTTSQSPQNVYFLNEFLHTYRKSHGYFQINVNWPSYLHVWFLNVALNLHHLILGELNDCFLYSTAPRRNKFCAEVIAISEKKPRNF